MNNQIVKQFLLSGCVIVFACVMGGCVCTENTHHSRNKPIGAEDAVRIAVNYVTAECNWTSHEVVGVRYHGKDNCWAVLLGRLPNVPDAHLLINVSADTGTILKFY